MVGLPLTTLECSIVPHPRQHWVLPVFLSPAILAGVCFCSPLLQRKIIQSTITFVSVNLSTQIAFVTFGKTVNKHRADLLFSVCIACVLSLCELYELFRYAFMERVLWEVFPAVCILKSQAV